ncbi:U4/U6 small nuclear ribonucleoprotein Prp4-like protein [Histomonas meleagridis]|uniref:U4/U6 small nuclear ribonucleoprotein Prp4-like protein n=1 Tax=Histomonas meleagridis TaxID=135588 RepID=UPI00355A7724|nr:U4/U6 small nuclear ribonucleoprotein Prp4-like protein [Histomonas meleagridis]KAH0799233.1 U4/U6 small nuclear ribonucleoprotein Prp4-like protein [Histomonas meleagridis]
MKQSGNLYDEYQLSKAMKEVPVPTSDIDVKIYLRKLKQPICLFGEDAKERKDRLRLILAKGIASNVPIQEEVPELIPKYVEGDEKIGEAKRFFIDYSIHRAQQRIENEKPIDQPRIDFTNEVGRSFQSFSTYASESADKRPLTSLSVHGDLFALGSFSSNITVFSASSMELQQKLQGHSDRITSLSFVSGNVLFSTSFDKTVRFWRIGSDDTAFLSFDQFAQSSASHPSERFSLAGLTDGTFCLIDVETQQVISRMKSHDGTVSTLCVHPDGSIVMTGGSDTIGRLWDLRSMKSIKVMQGHSSGITCSRFDNDYHVVSGGADNSIISWDMRNLSRSKTISAHTSPVSAVYLNGDILLSSSLDRTMKIWSLLDFRLYCTITDCPSPVTSCAFIDCNFSDQPYILSASRDGYWRLYHNAAL